MIKYFYELFLFVSLQLFTTQGLQLCKITVVGIDGKLVYETLVQPEDHIIDYNTRFSGVSAKDLKRGPTKSLKDVQNDLLGFINANTILIGHSLENDLRALKVSSCREILTDESIIMSHDDDDKSSSRHSSK